MLLQLKNIGKIYDSNDILTIGIRGIDLDFDYNEFVTIEGESGSGKSTLLNVIGANDSYEEGELYIDGEETSHYGTAEWEKYREKYIATVFQDFNIIENLTVLENVELALLRYDDKKTRIEKARELIEKVGLLGQINQRGSKLSGGEKQRTVIARALAKDSPIILADEPTGNLDVKSSREIAKLLKDVSKGKLVIVVTHNPEFFVEYATRRITISDGHLVEPNGKIKIGLKANSTFNRNEVVAYLMADDGTLTQLTTTNGGSYINLEINKSGTIILCIPGVAFHMPIWGYILILVGAVVIVADVVVTIIAATKRKKQNMNSC